MPGTHQTVLNSRTMCAEGVIELEFARPAGYEFVGGQWFRLTLQTAEGEQTKTFSHASSPQEPSLLMATRLSDSAFKRALAALAPGDAVRIQGPGGRLGLPEGGASRAVFLTGGVGVTPVRSLLRERVDSGKRFDDALVVFGNRTESCVPFLEDLRALEADGVRTVVVISGPTPGWRGETGHIEAALVRRHLDSVEGRPFVVTGPPPMVEAMRGVLEELGVAPELRLVEQFGAPDRSSDRSS